MTQLGVFKDEFYNSSAVLPQSGIATTTQATGTVAAASLLVGAQDQYAVFSGQAAITVTTDSAANIIAALQNTVNVQNIAAGNPLGVQPAGVPNLNLLSYTLTIVNNNSAALTLAAGAGVTLTAGAAAITLTSVTFVVKVTSPTTVSIIRVASGAV